MNIYSVNVSTCTESRLRYAFVMPGRKVVKAEANFLPFQIFQSLLLSTQQQLRVRHDLIYLGQFVTDQVVYSQKS